MALTIAKGSSSVPSRSELSAMPRNTRASEMRPAFRVNTQRFFSFSAQKPAAAERCGSVIFPGSVEAESTVDAI